MSVGFKNITKCQTKEAIAAGDTTIKLQNIADYVPYISSPGTYVYAILRDHQYFEIVKITVASSTVNGLSVARGQEGTSARAWKRGTLLYQDITAAAMGDFNQKGIFRTVAYNPNGILSPAYTGEKVYQTDATACKKRWWKSFNATDPYWALIVGTICDGESVILPDGFDWSVIMDAQSNPNLSLDFLANVGDYHEIKITDIKVNGISFMGTLLWNIGATGRYEGGCYYLEIPVGYTGKIELNLTSTDNWPTITPATIQIDYEYIPGIELWQALTEYSAYQTIRMGGVGSAMFYHWPDYYPAGPGCNGYGCPDPCTSGGSQPTFISPATCDDECCWIAVTTNPPYGTGLYGYLQLSMGRTYGSTTFLESGVEYAIPFV